MGKVHCKICKRVFSSAGELTRHANAIHHGRTSLSQTSESQQSIQSPEHDSSLWDTPITRRLESTSSSFAESSTSHVNTEDVVDETRESESRYFLRSQAESESEENIDESIDKNIEEMEMDLQINFEDRDFDSEDLQGASFDDALNGIEGKNRPERIAMWPNNAYRDFMELIIEGNISNKIGDKIIKFFNKHSNLKDSPLPNLTKNGKNYLNQINSPSLDFKEKVVATYNEVNFTLYYRPIFRSIQTLIQ